MFLPILVANRHLLTPRFIFALVFFGFSKDIPIPIFLPNFVYKDFFFDRILVFSPIVTLSIINRSLSNSLKQLKYLLLNWYIAIDSSETVSFEIPAPYLI